MGFSSQTDVRRKKWLKWWPNALIWKRQATPQWQPPRQGRGTTTGLRGALENRAISPQQSVQSKPVAQSREVRKLLEGIGTPRAAPFKPDPFQLEALAALEFEDVLVTAPTGSGKTWIAREEIRRLLAAGRRAWYTTPLKALTNSKYQEFAEEFGDEQGWNTDWRSKREYQCATDRRHHGNLSQSTV